MADTHTHTAMCTLYMGHRGVSPTYVWCDTYSHAHAQTLNETYCPHVYGVGVYSHDICMVYIDTQTHKHITGGREAASCLPAKRRCALVVLPGDTSRYLSACVCVYVQMCTFICIHIRVCDGYLYTHTHVYINIYQIESLF